MYCRQCGEEIKNEKAVICIKCGTSKGQGDSFCNECGAEVNNKNSEVCLKCGVSLKRNNTMNNFTNQINNAASHTSNNNSKMVAGLLALFLGSVGLHRFYLGYMKIGLIQLAIFVVALFVFAPAVWTVTVWALIDMVFIFTGKLHNMNGTELV